MALIDNPDLFDAVMIVQRAECQIWDEYVSVLAPESGFDSLVPPVIVDAIFANPGMVFLHRVAARLMAQA